MSERAYLVHPETGGSQWVPNDPDVIKDQGLKGWVLDQLPPELNPDAQNSAAIFLAPKDAVTEDVAAPSTEDREEAPKKPAKKAASTDDHEGVNVNG